MKPDFGWCYHHLQYEDAAGDVYRVCGECLHIYRTPEDLVKAFNEESRRMAEHWNELLKGTTVPDVRTLTIAEVQHIGFCQYCLHDW